MSLFGLDSLINQAQIRQQLFAMSSLKREIAFTYSFATLVCFLIPAVFGTAVFSRSISKN